jgi:hypothetical protein
MLDARLMKKMARKIELEKEDVVCDTFDDDVGDDAPSTFIYSSSSAWENRGLFLLGVRNTV